MSQEQFELVADLIADSTSIWIGAGAGMGVDSGLPDFRGDEGFWKAYPPYRNLGYSFYDLANPKWFASKPAQAWGFYGHRLKLYRETIPHEGFQILRKWARAKNDNCFVFTSNVDGHFQRAGFDEQQVVECHGSIHYLQCSQPCSPHVWSAKIYEPVIDESTMLAADPLPACERCGAMARPNILMFGDWNWVADRTHRQLAGYEPWLKNLSERNVTLEFGAGTAVPTVRHEASRASGTLVRVNPREPETPQGISVACGALEFLKEVDSVLGW